eukprot:gb/GEZN01001576.1/.p1 GENE.gb/GEZN01001576.1/~~gb/GEZN01001576.1/.p1  ORF type:complete len:263 (-),score=32.36 gb/GEZN01001576.1/:1709-2497(-)
MIQLTVERPDVYDYTLIDLPGLVYTAQKGQSENIGKIVRKIVHQQIQQPNTLILCVFMGGMNPEAQEAHKAAEEVDPEGNRTIGVLTKMDKQLAEASRLGMFAVRNRTHVEMSNNLPLEEVDKLEQSLIEEHALGNLKMLIGKDKLAAKLAQLLAKRVYAWLPQLLPKILEQRNELQNRLESINDRTNEIECYRYLRSISFKLEKDLSNLEIGLVDTTLTDELPTILAHDLIGTVLRVAMKKETTNATLDKKAEKRDNKRYA